jgi:hypothetical protein
MDWENGKVLILLNFVNKNKNNFKELSTPGFYLIISGFETVNFLNSFA